MIADDFLRPIVSERAEAAKRQGTEKRVPTIMKMWACSEVMPLSNSSRGMNTMTPYQPAAILNHNQSMMPVSPLCCLLHNCLTSPLETCCSDLRVKGDSCTLQDWATSCSTYHAAPTHP